MSAPRAALGMLALVLSSGCQDVKHFARVSPACDPHADRCEEVYGCFDHAGREVNYGQCSALPYRVYLAPPVYENLGDGRVVNNPREWRCYGQNDAPLTLQQCAICFDWNPGHPNATQSRTMRNTPACVRISQPPPPINSPLYPFNSSW
jgi:hypothetical protein